MPFTKALKCMFRCLHIFFSYCNCYEFTPNCARWQSDAIWKKLARKNFCNAVNVSQVHRQVHKLWFKSLFYTYQTVKIWRVYSLRSNITSRPVKLPVNWAYEDCVVTSRHWLCSRRLISAVFVSFCPLVLWPVLAMGRSFYCWRVLRCMFVFTRCTSIMQKMFKYSTTCDWFIKASMLEC